MIDYGRQFHFLNLTTQTTLTVDSKISFRYVAFVRTNIRSFGIINNTDVFISYLCNSLTIGLCDILCCCLEMFLAETVP